MVGFLSLPETHWLIYVPLGSGFVLRFHAPYVALTSVNTALQCHATESCQVVVYPSRPHGTVPRTQVRMQLCSGKYSVLRPWLPTYRGTHIAIQMARGTLPKIVRTRQSQNP